MQFGEKMMRFGEACCDLLCQRRRYYKIRRLVSVVSFVEKRVLCASLEPLSKTRSSEKRRAAVVSGSRSWRSLRKEKLNESDGETEQQWRGRPSYATRRGWVKLDKQVHGTWLQG